MLLHNDMHNIIIIFIINYKHTTYNVAFEFDEKIKLYTTMQF